MITLNITRITQLRSCPDGYEVYYGDNELGKTKKDLRSFNLHAYPQSKHNFEVY